MCLFCLAFSASHGLLGIIAGFVQGHLLVYVLLNSGTYTESTLCCVLIWFSGSTRFAKARCSPGPREGCRQVESKPLVGSFRVQNSPLQMRNASGPKYQRTS